MMIFTEKMAQRAAGFHLLERFKGENTKLITFFIAVGQDKTQQPFSVFAKPLPIDELELQPNRQNDIDFIALDCFLKYFNFKKDFLVKYEYNNTNLDVIVSTISKPEEEIFLEIPK